MILDFRAGFQYKKLKTSNRVEPESNLKVIQFRQITFWASVKGLDPFISTTFRVFCQLAANPFIPSARVLHSPLGGNSIASNQAVDAKDSFLDFWDLTKAWRCLF
jgi:hypothetical protein